MNVDKVDTAITRALRHHGLKFLRYSIAVIFIWFGALKLFDVSPAAQLVKDTVYWVDRARFIPFLALWEIVISFLVRPLWRIGIGLLAPQMLGTFHSLSCRTLYFCGAIH